MKTGIEIHDTAAQFTVDLPDLNGLEVRPGITLIGQATPIPGTNKMRCLASVAGCRLPVRGRALN